MSSLLSIGIFGNVNTGKTTLSKLIDYDESYTCENKYDNYTQYIRNKYIIYDFANNNSILNILHEIDVLIYVISHNDTSDLDYHLQFADIGKKITEQKTKYNKDTMFILCVNKCDQDDNFSFVDKTSILSSNKTIEEICDNIKKYISNDSFYCIKMSALYTYLYVYIKTKIHEKTYDKVPEDMINLVGVHLYGKSKWTKYSKATRKSELSKSLKNMSINDIHKEFGYNIEQILECIDIKKVLEWKTLFFIDTKITDSNISKLICDFTDLYNSSRSEKLLSNKHKLKDGFDDMILTYIGEKSGDDYESLVSRYNTINTINNEWKFSNENFLIQDEKDRLSRMICELIILELQEYVVHSMNIDLSIIFDKIKKLKIYGYKDMSSIINKCILENVFLSEYVDNDKKIIECCEIIETAINDIEIAYMIGLQLLLNKYNTRLNDITHLFLAEKFFTNVLSNNSSNKNYVVSLEKFIFEIKCIIYKLSIHNPKISHDYIQLSKSDENIMIVEKYIRDLYKKLGSYMSNIIHSEALSDESECSDDTQSESDESYCDNNSVFTTN